jgi:hypothetical protein
MRCPESKLRYRESPAGMVRCLDLGEEQELPAEMTVGTKSHSQWKSTGG